MFQGSTLHLAVGRDGDGPLQKTKPLFLNQVVANTNASTGVRRNQKILHMSAPHLLKSFKS
jgi:hypothetical protein